MNAEEIRALEQRHQALSRQRDVLAGRLEAAQAERSRYEQQMREYGATSIDELRVLVATADADAEEKAGNARAALEEAKRILAEAK